MGELGKGLLQMTEEDAGWAYKANRFAVFSVAGSSVPGIVIDPSRSLPSFSCFPAQIVRGLGALSRAIYPRIFFSINAAQARIQRAVRSSVPLVDPPCLFPQISCGGLPPRRELRAVFFILLEHVSI